MEHSLTIKRASVAVAASQTDSAVVAAVTGPNRAIRVLAACLTCSAATTVTLKSKPAGAGTAISPVLDLAPGLTPLRHDSAGWFETKDGEGLAVDTGAGTGGVKVHVIYTEV
jgi:hypothetical protein